MQPNELKRVLPNKKENVQANEEEDSINNSDQFAVRYITLQSNNTKVNYCSSCFIFIAGIIFSRLQ